MCQEFHALPVSGGLFEQPQGYVKRMEAVLLAQQASSEADRNKAKAQEKNRRGVKGN